MNERFAALFEKFKDVLKSVGYHGYLFGAGVLDGCRIDKPLRLLFSKPSSAEGNAQKSVLRSRLIKNLTLNGAILFGSTALFEFGALPLIESFCAPLSWLPWVADIGFDVLWFVPAYGVCFLASNAIYDDISKSYLPTTQAANTDARTSDEISLAMNDKIALRQPTENEVKRYGMVLPLLGASGALFYLPFVGPVLSFLSSSLVTSFYANEYRWNQQGISLEAQSKTMDHHFAYFIGQGALLTALSFFCPPTVGMSIMLLGFPLLMMNARHSSFEQRKQGFTAVKPSRLYLPNLPLFNTAAKISNMLFGVGTRWFMQGYQWLTKRQIALPQREIVLDVLDPQKYIGPPKPLRPMPEFKFETGQPLLFMGNQVNGQYQQEKVIDTPTPPRETLSERQEALFEKKQSIQPRTDARLRDI